MKTTSRLLCLIAVFSCSILFAQDEKKPSPQEQAWMAYMATGEMHKMLDESTGMWTEELSLWMAPEAPETKSTATVMNRMIMGGRYQQGMHRGSIDGMPFEGMSIVGYDNAKKKFVSTWIDNMGTGIMMMEGEWNAKDKSVQFKGMAMDPVSGKEIAAREVFKIVDANTQTIDMYMTTAEGKEYRSMHITLKKKDMPKPATPATPATTKPAPAPTPEKAPVKPAEKK